MQQNTVVAHYKVTSYAIGLILSPGADYADPVTGVLIGFRWEDGGRKAEVTVTVPGKDPQTQQVTTGFAWSLGQIGALAYQMEITDFRGDTIAIGMTSA